MFEVLNKRCSQCLFSDNKIVSEKRKREVLKEVLKKDSFFICHMSSLVGGSACCRGFFDVAGKNTRAVRMAHALDLVRFVDVPKEEE